MFICCVKPAGEYHLPASAHMRKHQAVVLIVFIKTDVLVQINGTDYLYSNINVQITYNYGYMDYQLSLVWEDDKSQISYTSLVLHGTYSSNFQMFTFS